MKAITPFEYLRLINEQLAGLQAPGYTDLRPDTMNDRIRYAKLCVDTLLMQTGFMVSE